MPAPESLPYVLLIQPAVQLPFLHWPQAAAVMLLGRQNALSIDKAIFTLI